MMKSKQHIEVTINPEGAISINAKGYTGNSCEEATAFLENQLGTVGDKQRTRDWYRRGHNNNQQKQQT